MSEDDLNTAIDALRHERARELDEHQKKECAATQRQTEFAAAVDELREQAVERLRGNGHLPDSVLHRARPKKLFDKNTIRTSAGRAYTILSNDSCWMLKYAPQPPQYDPKNAKDAFHGAATLLLENNNQLVRFVIDNNTHYLLSEVDRKIYLAVDDAPLPHHELAPDRSRERWGPQNAAQDGWGRLLDSSGHALDDDGSILSDPDQDAYTRRIAIAKSQLARLVDDYERKHSRT